MRRECHEAADDILVQLDFLAGLPSPSTARLLDPDLMQPERVAAREARGETAEGQDRGRRRRPALGRFIGRKERDAEQNFRPSCAQIEQEIGQPLQHTFTVGSGPKAPHGIAHDVIVPRSKTSPLSSITRQLTAALQVPKGTKRYLADVKAISITLHAHHVDRLTHLESSIDRLAADSYTIVS